MISLVDEPPPLESAETDAWIWGFDGLSLNLRLAAIRYQSPLHVLLELPWPVHLTAFSTFAYGVSHIFGVPYKAAARFHRARRGVLRQQDCCLRRQGALARSEARAGAAASTVPASGSARGRRIAAPGAGGVAGFPRLAGQLSSFRANGEPSAARASCASAPENSGQALGQRRERLVHSLDRFGLLLGYDPRPTRRRHG